jgi:hypothetical protein
MPALPQGWPVMSLYGCGGHKREKAMPRRIKRFIGRLPDSPKIGKTLVDGGRSELVGEAEGVPLFEIIDPVPVKVRGKVATHVKKFREFSPKRTGLTKSQRRAYAQFINDLADECVFARTLRLHYLIQDTKPDKKWKRTRPDEWTTRWLAVGVGAVLRRYGFKAAISENDPGGEKRGDEKVRSLYLRFLPGLIEIAGFPVPKDIRRFCQRARKSFTIQGKTDKSTGLARPQRAVKIQRRAARRKRA